jgi:hypothetical protein
MWGIEGDGIRLKNRRVMLFGPHLGAYKMVFKKLNDEKKIDTHVTVVSEEAFGALFRLMANEMNRRLDMEANEQNPMLKNLADFYADPQRHSFCSQHDKDLNKRTPGGGEVRGSKTVCAHCGAGPDKHVFVET